MLATEHQLHVALLTFVAAVAIIDWRTHRIPNLLCATAALVGLSSQMWLHGEGGLLAALGGAAVGFTLFLPFYVLRAFGAGDVKAMATVGIFLGVEASLLAVGATLIAGAVLGVGVLALRPLHAKATLHRLFGLFATPLASMRGSMQNQDPATVQRFPYGIAIACGTAIALLITTN
jgi:prepilin peptidase CpaA